MIKPRTTIVLFTLLLALTGSVVSHAQSTQNATTPSSSAPSASKTDTTRPVARPVPNNIMGRYTRLVLSCTDVLKSMAWWARLGYNPIQGMSPRPDSAMTLTDGQLIITLVKTRMPSPVVMFRTENMLKMNEKLFMHGIPLVADIKGPTYGEIRIKSPSSVYIAIRSENDEPLMNPAGTINPICGKVTELSIASTNLKAEADFWLSLGFVPARASDVPYPFAVMTDNHVQVGLHENKEIPSLAITYFSMDMPERIDRLKKSGMAITEEIPSEDGHLGNIILTSPDGQLVYMFEGEQ